MKIDWKNSNRSPYDMVSDVIGKWCEYNNYYCDMMVLLKIDGVEEKSVLECDCDVLGGWTWDWDWFEGGEIELLGFCPVDEVIIPEKYMLKD